MSQRSKAVETLADYFEKKGEILSPTEYRRQKDTPIRPQQVKKVFGNWSRMEKIVRAFDARNKNKPEATTNAREIINEQNRLAAEHEAMIRAIGEDVEQKTAREEAARAQIEADAIRAATPEGARANKVRKGGTEDLDAKVVKETVQRIVATEHAMFAKTPEGAALGKELLGGVEDQDAKNAAIARENARTERSAALAATGEGSALAMMEEDDSDGHLTGEAEARLKYELRPYVNPAKKEHIPEIIEEATKVVRPELAEVIQASAKEDETMSQGTAERGDMMYARANVDTIVTEGDRSKAPPADRLPDTSVLSDPQDEKDTGISNESLKELNDAKPGKLTSPKSGAGNAARASGIKGELTPKAEQNKDSVNEEENKENPEAPPADRNPDPKFAKPAAASQEDTRKASAKTAPKK